MKKWLAFILFGVLIQNSFSQFTENYELGTGVVFQKAQKLYWENGVGADFASDFLLGKKIHLKTAFVTSRIGSALASNAIKQETFTLGAAWHFFPTRPYQIFTGLNTGFFKAHYEEPEFDVLPSTSMLAQFEGGLMYKFNFPLDVSASFGYNFLSKPGTLPLMFYQLKVFYRIK